MLSSSSATLSLEAAHVEPSFESPDNSELENRVVSACGRFESFDYKGQHFEIDWNEMTGDKDEEEIPHEQVMEEMRQYCEALATRRAVRR